jgi:hypothetical protein
MSARADGESAPRPVVDVMGADSAVAWLSEEWALASTRADGTLTAMRLSGGGSFEELTPRVEISAFLARYSPASQAFAYNSNEGGATEGFVMSVMMGPSGPRLGNDRQRLPVEGAQSLRWRQDGRELFVVGGDGALWAVPVERRGGALRLGAAERLFAEPFVQVDFDVYDNGRKFLFRVDPAAAHQTLGVVLDWPARLERSRE